MRPSPKSKGARRDTAQEVRKQMDVYRRSVSDRLEPAQLHRIGLAAKLLARLVSNETEGGGKDLALQAAIQQLYNAGDVVMKAGRQ